MDQRSHTDVYHPSRGTSDGTPSSNGQQHAVSRSNHLKDLLLLDDRINHLDWWSYRHNSQKAGRSPTAGSSSVCCRRYTVRGAGAPVAQPWNAAKAPNRYHNPASPLAVIVHHDIMSHHQSSYTAMCTSQHSSISSTQSTMHSKRREETCGAIIPTRRNFC